MRPVAAALLNLLSPWWAAQRGAYGDNKALAELVQLATKQDVHVMQFLANPVPVSYTHLTLPTKA